MAFVVQCPFCKARAKVPDRAIGAIGKCPKCASSFTLASVDDQHLPESVPSGNEADVEPVSAATLAAAIAAATASTAAHDAAAADSMAADIPQQSMPSGFEPAAVVGALALLLSGLALVAGSLSFLFAFVLPLSGLALLTGLIAIIVAWRTARRRLLLPITSSAAAAVLLLAVGFFPALLGPAYEHARRRPAPVPAGLRAVPLAGAPALAEMPEWVDAKRYALERDGLRVQVIRVSLLPPAAIDARAVPTSKERLLVRVRISRDPPDARPLERKDDPGPTLSDDTEKSFAMRHSEFFDRGGGKARPGLFPGPTIEETFAFDAPAAGWKKLRLELPAERWAGTGVFRFIIAAPEAVPQHKIK